MWKDIICTFIIKYSDGDFGTEMISLDDICFDLFSGDNRPRTTDALWYKEEKGKLTLYIIEFKF